MRKLGPGHQKWQRSGSKLPFLVFERRNIVLGVQNLASFCDGKPWSVFEKRNVFMGVQTIASVRDETQLIFHGATDSEEGSEDLSKTKISLKNIFCELRRLKSSAR